MAWVIVANADEVKAGVGRTVIAHQMELALFRVGEKIYCIENCCPHMSGPLAEGPVDGETVYCPWHYWPVNVRTGEVEYDPGLCAATFECRIDGDSVLVNLPSPDEA
jgi:nitrite reductase/ring-hydroxylating ferredoxin subunit